jgi:glucose/arabinose dehydrogenase
MNSQKATGAVAVAFGMFLMTFMASAPQGQAPAAPGGQVAPPAPGAPAGAPAPGGPQGGRGGGRGGPTPGQLLFNEQCSGCHGTDAAGGRAPSLFDQKWLDSTNDQNITRAIRNGVPNTEMEPFKALSDEQVFQLIAHIRTQANTAFRPRAAFNEKPDGTVIKSEKATFKVELVAEGLATPWALAFLPDGRILVTERDGRLQIVNKGQLTLVSGTPKVHVQQDAGLLDVEVHPRYAQNGWIYLAYVEALPGWVPPPPAPAPDPAAAPAAAPGRGRGGPPQPPSMTVVVRGKINARNEWTDQQTVWRAPNELYTTSGAHFGTRLTFDRENHLFFALGDRNFNPNKAQDLSSPFGKIHRFNDDGTVPKDNPFVGTPNAVASIWSYGHRNPEGFAWDPVSGALWSSEHGPNTADEVNLIVKGHNYGWNVVSKQGPPTYQLSLPNMDDPIVYFMPTFAPAGISFYTGNRFPGWRNTSLFVGGLAGQALRRIELKGSTVVGQEVVFSDFGRVRDIVQGPDGYFYVAVQNPTGVPNPAGGNIGLSASTPGRVIRLVPAQ